MQSKRVIPYEQAIDYYTNLIRANPQASLYCRRGTVWREWGEYDIAIADYNEAIRAEPGEAIYFVARGNAWANKKEYDKAIADYAEAIRLDPKYAAAYNNRGVDWKNKKEYDKAIADYAEAIRLDPKYEAAYNNRAWIWATCPQEKYRDGNRAVESATRACELTEWKDPELIDTLAAAYAESSDFDSARKFQRKAIDLLNGEKAKADYRTRLKLYEDSKPYREE